MGFNIVVDCGINVITYIAMYNDSGLWNMLWIVMNANRDLIKLGRLSLVSFFLIKCIGWYIEALFHVLDTIIYEVATV